MDLDCIWYLWFLQNKDLLNCAVFRSSAILIAWHFCSTCYRETLSRPARQTEHGVAPNQSVLVGLFWKCLEEYQMWLWLQLELCNETAGWTLIHCATVCMDPDSSWKYYNFSQKSQSDLNCMEHEYIKGVTQSFVVMSGNIYTHTHTCINLTPVVCCQHLSIVSAAQSCGPPPTVQNAQVHAQGETNIHNASYVCNAGLQLIGPRTLLCLANGTWSLPAPTCERMENDQDRHSPLLVASVCCSVCVI